MTTRRPGQREGPAGTEKQVVRVAHDDRESWRTRLWRWGLNFFPAYRGTGGRVTFIAADWSEVHVTIPLNWRTRNYVKTIFGGSMYGAVDPIYMFMLIKILGPEYVVWDKTAAIRFRRPGRERLFAKFVVNTSRKALERAMRLARPIATRCSMHACPRSLSAKDRRRTSPIGMLPRRIELALFDLEKDPGEKHNLVEDGSAGATFDTMKRALLRFEERKR